MWRFLVRWILLPGALLLAAVFALVWAVSEGVGGEDIGRGEPAATRRPQAAVRSEESATLAAAGSLAVSAPEQILFGDLHVHTTFSGDAWIFSLPLFQGEGSHPPADACDFARFCAGLDFWSINDHAESITPRQWRETKQAVRECNAVSGDPRDPDLVSFLGWEWTQSAGAAGRREVTHYGHKNVLLLDTEDDAVPTRPIGAGEGGLFAAPVPGWAWSLLRFGMASRDLTEPGPYLDFNHFTREVRALDTCAADVPVRDLPADCLEGADTPETLFRKLDDWGFPSLVIPHGTAWGIHAPRGSSLASQLSRAQHDPARQRLFEVYSGHGNSERFASMRERFAREDGSLACAEPSDGYLPCCWQAGEIIRARCEPELAASECEARVAHARELAAGADSPYSVVAGTKPDDWLECGQLPNGFLPAFEYRPQMSAQYGLALRSEDGSTFRYGLIGSSDNHKARAGAGYKERARKAYGDAYGFRDDWYQTLRAEQEPLPEALEEPAALATATVAFERGASYYYTGGLVAVHSADRRRESIFAALGRRNAYATSGDRILLWFDLLHSSGDETPMGSEVVLARDEPPRFRVRAVGAFAQQPGCPDFAREGLGAERLQKLCLGECYHPTSTRRRIERIEVVRIRKQRTPEEEVAPLIEDPWRSFACDDQGDGCAVEFDDPEYARATEEREFVYYVRALQEPTPAVNGDPVRCERDAQGRCIRARGCAAAGPDFDANDDCLAPVRERAWSSPIFVRP